MASRAGGSLFRNWLRAGPLRSAYGVSRRFVTRGKTAACARQLRRLTAAAVPLIVPAAFSELAHWMLNDGLWHSARCGSLPSRLALQRLAEELDVKIRLNCPVKQIVETGGSGDAIGVTLAADGDFLPADAVRLQPRRHIDGALPAAGGRNRGARAPSACVQTPNVQLRLHHAAWHPRDFPQSRPAHNIFFSEDYRAEFEHIHRRGLMPEDPTITLTISCKIGVR